MALTSSGVVEGDIVDYLENTDDNLLVSGKAGAGKSVQLKRYIARNRHRVLVVAPTGIAAINCAGATIHRTFRIPIDPIVDKPSRIRECAMKAGPELKAASTILIDEIGMVRADMWEVIDQILRIIKKNDKPFGGVRIIAFGDLYQLPPIVKRAEEEFFLKRYKNDRGYFFCTEVMKKVPFKVVELTKVFRQRDDRFIAILNSVRVGVITNEQLALLNSRFRPDFKAAEGFVTLCPRNATADRINQSRLASLPGKEVDYVASFDDGFPKSSKPNDDVVTLKEGCQVMVIKNLYPTDGPMIPNGKVGIVKELFEESAIVEIDGNDTLVPFEEWESHRTFVEDGKLDSESVGCFRQIPLRISYACTIHKSQGVTLDRVVIDMEGGAFADGQTYVALSRCRSLDGIVLKCKLAKSDIHADDTLTKFMAWSQMNERYVEFIQDTIPEVNGKGVVVENPVDIIKDGARDNGWITESEIDALNEILLGGEANECLAVTRMVLPRLVDEIRCARTEIADLKANLKDCEIER